MYVCCMYVMKMSKLRDTSKFKADKGFQGAEENTQTGGANRSEPVSSTCALLVCCLHFSIMLLSYVRSTVLCVDGLCVTCG